MPQRALGERDIQAAAHWSLGVGRLPWEERVSPVGGRLIAREGDVVLGADATLYDTEELLRELRSAGRTPQGSAPCDLMIAAYMAWGTSFTRRLNGDFAFVLWDGAKSELMVGRDFVGRRSLFVRDLADGSGAVASQATALATISTRPTLNHDFIAAAISGLLSGSRESAYIGVRPVPAGDVLAWRAGRGWRTAFEWKAPTFVTRARGDLREGAEELRRLLVRAVSDRCTSPRLAVYLSGGADSPAVYGAAQSAREQGTLDCTILPVSVSFPVGDSAREDEHIEAVARHWGATPTFIDSESMVIFDAQESRAAVRDDPYAHTFEQMNRHLGNSAARLEAGVALDGHGGDLLFQVSDVAIAEVLAAGDVRGWRRLIREGGYRTWQEILRWGLLPALPNVMWRTFDMFRARPLQRPFEQDLPSWLTNGARAGVEGRGWTHAELSRRILEGPAAFESRWYLSAPYMARAVSWTHDVAQQCGLELRSPLLDRRIVEFAAGRPVVERASVTETKRLLRESMRGLVPDSVLAPRAYKTGVPRGYLGRQLQHGLGPAMDRALSYSSPRGSSMVLADLGIVELSQLNAARDRYKSSPDHLTGVQLFLTLEVELWLRNHVWFTPTAL